MTHDAAVTAAYLLFWCFVPATFSVLLSQPHFDTKYVYLYHERTCPESITETHWPNGKVTCHYQKKAHGSAITSFPTDGGYLK